jgi:predicted P-loop ATPase
MKEERPDINDTLRNEGEEGVRARHDKAQIYKRKKLTKKKDKWNGTVKSPKWADITDEGDPKRTYRNSRAAITALGIACSYDEFHDRMLVAGHPINEWAGELSDAVNVMLRQVIIEQFGFDPGKDNVADATTELCLENRFDPTRDYLDGLVWDGTARLDNWLTTYLGAEDNNFNNAIGRLTLIAGVRRVKEPGCKFDYILTLEGPEGTKKSTSIVTLAGIENFSDQTILTASDKEQQELVSGVWLYEIADLAGMRRADVEKIKAFASRTHDRARPAYGRRRVDAPRRCVFFATTNEDEYLQSPTGNRRFWPVKTGTINIEALRRDRDQLWAEAARIEAKGEPLILPQNLWSEASSAQDERRQHDPWDDTLTDIKGHLCTDTGQAEERIRSDELFKYLDIPTSKATNADALRLKRAMRRLGWSGPNGDRTIGSPHIMGITCTFQRSTVRLREHSLDSL